MTSPGPFTTPFDATSTAAEVLAGVDLTGRRAIVTGGASGIGIETVRALAAAEADVTLAVRRLDAGEAVAGELAAATGNSRVRARHLDLADPASVTGFVEGWDGPLDILINNAGVMASPQMHTSQGWELQFATNHLGHFALATGLHAALAASGAARVVSVSSSAHLRSPIRFDDLHFQRDPYDPWLAYGQSKTANVLFAVEAARRWAQDSIAANSLMPGGIQTNLQRYVPAAELERMRAAAGTGNAPAWKSPEQGASTSILLAASPLVEGVSGRYFENCNEAPPHQPGMRTGVAGYALDPQAAARLWELSERLLARAT